MHPFLAGLPVLWRHMAPVTTMLLSLRLLVVLPTVSEFPFSVGPFLFLLLIRGGTVPVLWLLAEHF